MSFLILSTITAQDKFFTKSGKIVFDATSAKSPENILGVNKTVTCVFDTKTGALQFAVLMKGFEFEKALMQEHFNENYVESNKFPKAEFRGAVTDPASLTIAKEGVYAVKVKGKLTIHGETRDVESEGKITVKGGRVQAVATFQVILSDYGVNVPQLVADKVARSAKINVDCLLDPLK
jgi:polyisoprenoid-binding protein YceI